MSPLTLIPTIGTIFGKIEKFVLKPIRNLLGKIERPLAKMREKLESGKTKLDQVGGEHFVFFDVQILTAAHN